MAMKSFIQKKIVGQAKNANDQHFLLFKDCVSQNLK